MAAYFLDSSAVVKRYAKETGTSWVQAVAAPAAGHLLTLVRITLVETVAAVPRKERGGFLTPQAAATALQDFQLDFGRQYAMVELAATLVAHAATLARKHALRGYDVVQFAAALEVQSQVPSLTLLSADANLISAATTEGLTADDHNTHP